MEQCSGHGELMLSIARIEGKIDAMTELNSVNLVHQNERMAVFNQHIKESIPIRDDVRDNKKFRNSVTKAIWIAYSAIAGLFIKVVFFK